MTELGADCAVHTREYDEDCEFCGREKHRHEHELDIIIQQNIQKQTELAKYRAVVDPQSLLQGRLEALIQFAFSDSPKQRLRFELYFQAQFGEALDKMASAVRQAQLLQGVNGTPLPPMPGQRPHG